MGHSSFVYPTYHLSSRFRFLCPPPESTFTLERKRPSKAVEVAQGFFGLLLSGGFNQVFRVLFAPILQEFVAEFIPTCEMMIKRALGLGQTPTKLVDGHPLRALLNQNL